MSFILGILLLVSSQAFAQYGAVTSASAGAGRAAIEPSDSAGLNPATLSFMRGYHITSSVSQESSIEGYHGNAWQVQLVDAMGETVVPTAVMYRQAREFDYLENEHSRKEIRLSMAMSTWNWLHIGTTLRYQEDLIFADRTPQTNLNFGALIGLSSDFGIGAVFENVFDPEKRVPPELRFRPLTSVGFTYNYRSFVRFKADVTTDSDNTWRKPSFRGGLESFMNQWIVVRFGLMRDFEQRSDLYAAGLGFQGPKFQLNYAFQKSNRDDALSRHAVDLAIPIW